MRLSIIAVIVLLGAAAPAREAAGQGAIFSLFERYLESLRQQAGIPGLSAAIVHDGRIAWERGFGFQDIDALVAAAPDTPYPIGDLTQTFAAALILQCVERGSVDLDEPIETWTPLPGPDATLRQVLAHNSDAASRTGFKYDPGRYAALTEVIADCGDGPFRRVLAREILDRLAMVDSVPGHDLADPSAGDRELFDQDRLDRYGSVLDRLATPYRVDRRRRVMPSAYPDPGINSATGLIATVRDLARFDEALDDRILLRSNTLELAWTNVVAANGLPLPSGLGWFVQTHNGQRLVWHFGLSPGAFSSLVLKVPERGLTLILLANSDGLSAPFPLAEGDVTSSLFARVFLQLFL